MKIELTIQGDNFKDPNDVEYIRFLDLVINRGYKIIKVKKNGKVDGDYKKHININ